VLDRTAAKEEEILQRRLARMNRRRRLARNSARGRHSRSQADRRPGETGVSGKVFEISKIVRGPIAIKTNQWLVKFLRLS
jgi:hypothetical protein